MKLPHIREMYKQSILIERERCAKVALKEIGRTGEGAEFSKGWNMACESIAEIIRSANPPSFRVVIPQTEVDHPEQMTPYTIVSGGAYIDKDDKYISVKPHLGATEAS